MPRVFAKTLIIAPDGDILFLRRSPDDDYRAGGWDFPGGNVDPGEDAYAAAKREAMEESGITLANPRLLFGRSVEIFGDSATWLIFAEYVSNKPEVTLSAEHSEYAWMSAADMLAQTDYDWHRELLGYIVAQGLTDSVNGNKTSVTCRSLVCNEAGKVLMARRGPTDPFKPGAWDLPGGGLEAGEGLLQAVARETREEVGIAISDPKVVFAITAPRTKGSRTWVFFAVHTSDQPVLGDEHDKLQWIDIADLPSYTDYDVLLYMQTHVTKYQLV